MLALPERAVRAADSELDGLLLGGGSRRSVSCQAVRAQSAHINLRPQLDWTLILMRSLASIAYTTRAAMSRCVSAALCTATHDSAVADSRSLSTTVCASRSGVPVVVDSRYDSAVGRVGASGGSSGTAALGLGPSQTLLGTLR
jgi:hypothetical protein